MGIYVDHELSSQSLSGRLTTFCRFIVQDKVEKSSAPVAHIAHVAHTNDCCHSDIFHVNHNICAISKALYQSFHCIHGIHCAHCGPVAQVSHFSHFPSFHMIAPE